MLTQFCDLYKEKTAIGKYTQKIINFETLLSNFFDLGSIYTDVLLYRIALDGVDELTVEKSNQIKSDDTNTQVQTPVAKADLNEKEITEKKRTREFNFESNQTIILYIIGFKSLAYRVPILLASFSFFKLTAVNSFLNKSNQFTFIQKPMQFFEMISNKPSLASVIGLTFYLVLTFYVLSIATTYFAIEIFDDDLAKPKKPEIKTIEPVHENFMITAQKTAKNFAKNSMYYLGTAINFIQGKGESENDDDDDYEEDEPPVNL